MQEDITLSTIVICVTSLTTQHMFNVHEP